MTKNSYAHRCAVLGCPNMRNGTKSFFCFPSTKEPFRCLKWVVFCQREEVANGFFQCPSYLRKRVLCSEHFSDCCFMNVQQNSLVHDAVPNLFFINPQRVLMYPHHPWRHRQEESPTYGGEVTVDVAVLKESMKQQTEELEIFLENTWRDNDYKLDTLAIIPHSHKRIPAGKHHLFEEETSQQLSALPWTTEATVICEETVICEPHLPHQSNSMPASDCLPPSRTMSLKRAMPETEEFGSLQCPPKKRIKGSLNHTSLGNGTVKYASFNNNNNINKHIITFGNCEKNTSEPVLVDLDNEIKEEPTSSSMSAYYICCVQGCTSTNKTCMLYPFPANPVQAEKWLEKCSRHDLIPFLRLNGSVPYNFLMCRKHFHNNQFREINGQESLRLHAVPVFFPGVGASRQQTKIRKPGPRRVIEMHLEHATIEFPTSSGSSIRIIAPTQIKRGEKDPAASVFPEDPCLRIQRLVPSCVTLEFCAGEGLGLRAGQRCKEQLLKWEHRRRQLTDTGSATSLSKSRCSAADQCASKACRLNGPAEMTLQNFPRERDRCLAWLENLGDASLLAYLRVHGAAVCHEDLALCAMHFQPNCFYHSAGVSRLTTYAVPTLFANRPPRHPCQHRHSRFTTQCGHLACRNVAEAPDASLEEVEYLERKRKWFNKVLIGDRELAFAVKRGRGRPRKINYAMTGPGSNGAAIAAAAARISIPSLPAAAWHTPQMAMSRRGGALLAAAASGGDRTGCGAGSSDEDDMHDHCGSVKTEMNGMQRYLRVTKRDVFKKIDKNRIVTDEEKRKLVNMDEEMVDLQREVKLLYKQVAIRKSAIARLKKKFREKSYMPYMTDKDALESSKSSLTDYAYEFFIRQLTRYSKPHWNVASSKIPILMTKCGMHVWSLLNKLYKLPIKETLLVYKRKARADPSVFDYCPLMHQFVQKQYRSRFKRAKRWDVGMKKKCRPKDFSVSHIIEKYLKRNDNFDC